MEKNDYNSSFGELFLELKEIEKVSCNEQRGEDVYIRERTFHGGGILTISCC